FVRSRPASRAAAAIERPAKQGARMRSSGPGVMGVMRGASVRVAKVRAAVTMGALVLASVAYAQTPVQNPAQNPIANPTTVARVEFDEAVRRAIERNPTIAQAATAIVRAETVLRQTQGSFRPTVNAQASNITLNGSRGFEGTVTQPMNQ